MKSLHLEGRTQHPYRGYGNLPMGGVGGDFVRRMGTQQQQELALLEFDRSSALLKYSNCT